MSYKNGKIAQQIIESQNEDGTWGYEFHSMAIPGGKKPLTTERALRRLKILGFTIADEPYGKPLIQLPESFASVDTSRYLAAIER